MEEELEEYIMWAQQMTHGRPSFYKFLRMETVDLLDLLDKRESGTIET